MKFGHLMKLFNDKTIELNQMKENTSIKRIITIQNHDVTTYLGMKCHPSHHLGSWNQNQTTKIVLNKTNILGSSLMILCLFPTLTF